MARTATVSIHVEIQSDEHVWNTARSIYADRNIASDNDEFEMICGTEANPDVLACLQVIFDPGESPKGLQIEDSSAEFE